LHHLVPDFFLRPHQIIKPVTGRLAATRLAQNARILPGRQRISKLKIHSILIFK
jgi:hypothetical protein